MSVHSVHGSRCTCLDIISLKMVTLVHLKWQLSYFNLKISILHICMTNLSSVMVVAALIVAYNKNVIWNSKYIWQILNIYVSLEHVPASAAPKGSLAYLYLLNYMQMCLSMIFLCDIRSWHQ